MGIVKITILVCGPHYALRKQLHPCAPKAALATIRKLQSKRVHEHLDAIGWSGGSGPLPVSLDQ